MARRPLCFVLMPFGKKSAGGARPINFDAVYNRIIKPAVEQAGLEPIRADEEEAGGIIHKPMFERLVLCEYAIADLTTANANVFYELGVRHAAKPRTTVLMYAEGHGRLPFDVAQLRALPYSIGKSGGPIKVEASTEALVQKLSAAKKGTDKDSPLYQLLDDYPNVAHEKTDVFRDRIEYAAAIKAKIEVARKGSRDDLYQIEVSLGDLSDEEAGVIIDLFLSYRAISAWEDMIRLAGLMTPPLQKTVLVQEQLALALNRGGRGDEAENLLKTLIAERGASSETLGILGRVYKDRWNSSQAENPTRALGHLRQAIDAYTAGFEADWRDPYPGINALTLMSLADASDPGIKALRPVVEYAVERKIDLGDPDYWDYATLLELAVLGRDEERARAVIPDVLSRVRENWEAETTARNIGLISATLAEGSSEKAWVDELLKLLSEAAGGVGGQCTTSS